MHMRLHFGMPAFNAGNHRVSTCQRGILCSVAHQGMLGGKMWLTAGIAGRRRPGGSSWFTALTQRC
ncbi:hypothetical protein [Erwinia rhapontici]|uniref:hypothetical protein n=1 Tax=Erwinia rhapontici TaxID=55212 RepID=UPI001331A863|nr:hypothetical protein [Erwinia rhapontici]MBP2155176.1 hypothetical protein [Erwinia rhapontici]